MKEYIYTLIVILSSIAVCDVIANRILNGSDAATLISVIVALVYIAYMLYSRYANKLFDK